MRGFPPIQIFVLGLLFGLLAVPMVQLTGNATHIPEVEPTAAQTRAEKKPVPVTVRLRYAHKPVSISLKSEGRELLAKLDLSASPAEVKTEIAVSNDGNEFSLDAQWPAGTPDTALSLEIEPDGYDAKSETRWSSGAALSEILTFTW
jgi:hypothetical protein